MTAAAKRSAIIVCGVTTVLLAGIGVWRSRVGGAPRVPVDRLSISGVVLSNGQTPEAGVWVIAETDSLPRISDRSW
jgi:hypothetical protein